MPYLIGALVGLIILSAKHPQYTWKDCDFNRDASVDDLDWDIFAANFGKSDPGDINNDGIVNTNDFSIFRQYYKGPTKEELRQEVLRCWKDITELHKYINETHARINYAYRLFAPLEPNELQIEIKDILSR